MRISFISVKLFSEMLSLSAIILVSSLPSIAAEYLSSLILGVDREAPTRRVKSIVYVFRKHV